MFTKIENVKKPPFFVVFEHRLYLLKNISFSEDCFSQNLRFVRNYRTILKTLHQNIFFDFTKSVF